MRIHCWVTTVALLTAFRSAEAQKPLPTVTKVVFQCSCESLLASRYATEFRDLLAKSPRYAEAKMTERKADGYASFDWVIYVTGGPVGDDDYGSRVVALSVVLTWQNEFKANYALTCGANKISECAVATMAYLDQTVHEDDAKQ